MTRIHFDKEAILALDATIARLEVAVQEITTIVDCPNSENEQPYEDVVVDRDCMDGLKLASMR